MNFAFALGLGYAITTAVIMVWLLSDAELAGDPELRDPRVAFWTAVLVTIWPITFLYLLWEALEGEDE